MNDVCTQAFQASSMRQTQTVAIRNECLLRGAFPPQSTNITNLHTSKNLHVSFHTFVHGHLTLVLPSNRPCNFLVFWVKILYFQTLLLLFHQCFCHFFQSFCHFSQSFSFLMHLLTFLCFFPHISEAIATFLSLFSTYHFYFSNAIKLNKTCEEHCREPSMLFLLKMWY